MKKKPPDQPQPQRRQYHGVVYQVLMHLMRTSRRTEVRKRDTACAGMLPTED